MSPRARTITVRALIVLAAVTLVLALVAGYVRRAAVNSDQFANRATAALRDDSVRSLIAERITDDVVLERERDLIAARPVIQSVASSIIASRAFTSLFRSAVRDVHSAVFHRNADSVTLTVADVGTVLAAALEVLRPSARREGGVDGRGGDRPARPGQRRRRRSCVSRTTFACSRGSCWSSRSWRRRAPCCSRPTGGALWSSSASGPLPPALYWSSPTASHARLRSTTWRAPRAAPRQERCGTHSSATSAPPRGSSPGRER